MPSSVLSRPAGTERQTLPPSSTRQVKADLRPEGPGTQFRTVVADTVNRVTSQKAAAHDVAISEGRLSSKLKDGSLTVAQLESLGPSYLVALAEEILEQLGPLATPKARAKQQIRAARKALDELDQVVELIA